LWKIVSTIKCKKLIEYPIVGFDPGKTVGVALVKPTPPDALPLGEYKLFWQMYELQWPGDLAKLELLVKGAKTLVVEGFRLFPHQKYNLVGSDFVPVEVIGYLKAQAQARGIEYIEQLSSIKTTADDDLMEKFMGQPLHLGGHARDAMRHIIFHLINRYAKGD